MLQNESRRRPPQFCSLSAYLLTLIKVRTRTDMHFIHLQLLASPCNFIARSRAVVLESLGAPSSCLASWQS